jgi:excisionase family DNA binding protein
MPKRAADPETALFVRLPADAVDRLRRAAEALGIHKKDLVAGLVQAYVDPDSKKGLQTLDAISNPRRATFDNADGRPTLGAYSFQSYDPPEVLTVQEVADLLQVDSKLVLELAEAGDLPGRRIGKTWRFARSAVLAWLGSAST